ncbi:FIST N-terminal domain-containing protein [Paramylibacter kogurei]|uniref:FIST N-terminal domain-containing protein n=1 Tax=Paramylibacter kogurei TaxID=1889778 RepID=UPI001F0B3B22|nr:FIST N-terminal domain-containing protein [Amylibacter kogurei]
MNQQIDHIVRSASVAAHHPNAIQILADELGQDFAHVFLYVSPSADFDNVVHLAQSAFKTDRIVACTTAGEIMSGYTEDQIVAVGLPNAHFSTKTILINDVTSVNATDLIGDMIRARTELTDANPTFSHEVAFLIVDGLSLFEDQLVSKISSGLGPVPLFGGSAGDGTRFEKTFVSFNGTSHQNAAVLTFIRSDCVIETFSLDHLSASSEKMVVTRADPARRIVHEINAEPAAREYARILGKDPNQLSEFTFASNPLVVRVGGRHHVRAIQQVTKDNDLVFFSAIDEGLVLTLADAEDMETHLEREFSKIADQGSLDCMLICDCILRRLEAAQGQKTIALSNIMAKNRAIGFNTYGEQFGAMHVNQTMTGVAIYRPENKV